MLYYGPEIVLIQLSTYYLGVTVIFTFEHFILDMASLWDSTTDLLDLLEYGPLFNGNFVKCVAAGQNFACFETVGYQAEGPPWWLV